jgi:hypothetical protein
MQDLLAKLIGRKVDIVCVGAAAVRGELIKVENGVAELKEDNQTCYIAIDKIGLVWEARDHESRAGFVSGVYNTK